MVRFAHIVVWGRIAAWSSWFAARATEVSAIAVRPAEPERADGSAGQQTSATSRQSRAEKNIGTASRHIGSAGPVSA
jgi:hypothetical protein